MTCRCSIAVRSRIHPKRERLPGIGHEYVGYTCLRYASGISGSSHISLLSPSHQFRKDCPQYGEHPSRDPPLSRQDCTAGVAKFPPVWRRVDPAEVANESALGGNDRFRIGKNSESVEPRSTAPNPPLAAPLISPSQHEMRATTSRTNQLPHRYLQALSAVPLSGQHGRLRGQRDGPWALSVVPRKRSAREPGVGLRAEPSGAGVGWRPSGRRNPQDDQRRQARLRGVAKYVTLAAEAGANVKGLQTLARHSTSHLTMNVYAKDRNERLAELTEKIGESVLIDSECAKSVPSLSIEAEVAWLNLLPSNTLEQSEYNGGGGIRTPVPRCFKASVYMRSRSFGISPHRAPNDRLSDWLFR